MWNSAPDRDRSRPLAFLHIPKSGGTALGLAIAEALEIKSRIHAWDRCLFGGYSQFETWPPERMENVFLAPEQMPEDAEFLSGHLAASTIQRRYPDAQRLTLLREPRARLLSLWVFWRSLAGDLSQDIGSFAERIAQARGPLSEFLGYPPLAAQIDNVTARMLIWPHPLAPEEGFIAAENDEAVFEQALARLGEFDFVDIYENTKATSHLARWLRRPLHLRRANVTPSVPEAYRTNLAAELTARARDLLQQRTRIDARLWRAVAERVVGPEEAAAIELRTQAASEARYAALLGGGQSQRVAA